VDALLLRRLIDLDRAERRLKTAKNAS